MFSFLPLPYIFWLQDTLSRRETTLQGGCECGILVNDMTQPLSPHTEHRSLAGLPVPLHIGIHDSHSRVDGSFCERCHMLQEDAFSIYLLSSATFQESWTCRFPASFPPRPDVLHLHQHWRLAGCGHDAQKSVVDVLMLQ